MAHNNRVEKMKMLASMMFVMMMMMMMIEYGKCGSIDASQAAP